VAEPGSTGGSFLNKDKADEDCELPGKSRQKIAIVSGGLFGKSPGRSTQRNFLPHPYSDFIFAIIMEEYGLWEEDLWCCSIVFSFSVL